MDRYERVMHLELNPSAKRIQKLAHITRWLCYPILVIIKKINPESEIEL